MPHNAGEGAAGFSNVEGIPEARVTQGKRGARFRHSSLVIRNYDEVVDTTTSSVIMTPPNTMRCPKCGSRDDKVIDSRQSRDNSSIRRRRECLSCSYRFTTYEQVERSDLRVIKRDRSHESFDRRKLVNSLAKACEKRPISLVTLEHSVDEIVHELETSGREVQSTVIGATVLEKLRSLDEVAYLRYASIHKRFENVEEFSDAIHALGRRGKPNAQQRELFPAAEPVANHGRV